MRARTVCSVPGCPEPAVGRGGCATHRRKRGQAWHRLRATVLARDEGRCECGAPATVVSHLDPVWLGNPELPDASRLVSRCRLCARLDDMQATAKFLRERPL